MTSDQITYTARSPEDAEAIAHLERAIAAGKNWYIALLEAMGLWGSTEECYRGRDYRYLIDGEAFDWLLLAERLCQTINDSLPGNPEREALVFQGKPPLRLSTAELKKLIGAAKYRQYLNYFYGVTLEGLLYHAVYEEVQKEWHLLWASKEPEAVEETYRRIYGLGKTEMLRRYHRDKGSGPPRTMSLTQLKEFTYWLFKYRIEHCEKAKVASDTRKTLNYLKRQWRKGGLFGVLATDEPAESE
ncbi:MAG: hypothetical protein HYX96_01320 [Chloroflexi bacterium]|nr:hypothetical protein [Chloroflexota bacterium]